MPKSVRCSLGNTRGKRRQWDTKSCHSPLESPKTGIFIGTRLSKHTQIFCRIIFCRIIIHSVNEEETSRMKAEKLFSSPDLTNTCKTPTIKHKHSPIQPDKAAAMHRNGTYPKCLHHWGTTASEWCGKTRGMKPKYEECGVKHSWGASQAAYTTNSKCFPGIIE